MSGNTVSRAGNLQLLDFARHTRPCRPLGHESICRGLIEVVSDRHCSVRLPIQIVAARVRSFLSPIQIVAARDRSCLFPIRDRRVVSHLRSCFSPPLGASGRRPTKRLWISSGEPELMEDTFHCDFDSVVVRVDRFWVTRPAGWVGARARRGARSPCGSACRSRDRAPCRASPLRRFQSYSRCR